MSTNDSGNHAITAEPTIKIIHPLNPGACASGLGLPTFHLEEAEP